MCTKTNGCNFTSCRFNEEGICTNEEFREECVDMSRKVLCLDEGEQKDENGTQIEMTRYADELVEK